MSSSSQQRTLADARDYVLLIVPAVRLASTTTTTTTAMTRDSPLPASSRAPPDYKQLYDALLTRLEHATAIHQAHEATLSTAQAKAHNLQAECDMLLDALAEHPSLTHYLAEPEAPSR